MALAHDPALAAETLDRLDGLVITGGAFDVSPALYGATTVHATVTLKDRRTAAELALVQGALARDMPVLGICGGQQLLAVALGGTLIQHIPDSVAGALEHEQPNPRNEPGHAVAVVPGTQLHRIVGAEVMAVNSAHHQAVATPGAARHRERDGAGRGDRGRGGCALPVRDRAAMASGVLDRSGRPARVRRLYRCLLVSGADMDEAAPRGERIAKWLARAGVASRRDAEKLIGEGQVRLNGAAVTHPATFVTGGDIVQVGSKVVDSPERARLWRYHKPEGLVTTHKDPEERPTVFQRLPEHLPRVVSVGRLDLNSEGLLLLTNDGGLARRLELPSNGWIRRYRVRVHGVVPERALAGLADGLGGGGR